MNERLVCGKNAVKSVLVSGYEVDRVLISQTARGVSDIIGLAKFRKAVIKFVPPIKLQHFEHSQGVVAFVSPVRFFSLIDVLKFDIKSNKHSFFLLCDKILDPHNLGALIRTAFAVGVSGVVVSRHGCCPLTEAVEKAAAGALSHVKIVRVSNLVHAIDCMKKSGIFVYAADMDGGCFFEQNLTGPIAIVVGSEGKGIGRLVRKSCDGALKIPMAAGLNSLNVSVAGALLMFEVARQRKMF